MRHTRRQVFCEPFLHFDPLSRSRVFVYFFPRLGLNGFSFAFRAASSFVKSVLVAKFTRPDQNWLVPTELLIDAAAPNCFPSHYQFRCEETPEIWAFIEDFAAAERTQLRFSLLHSPEVRPFAHNQPMSRLRVR